MTIREKYAEQIRAAQGFDGIPAYVKEMPYDELIQDIKEEQERLAKLNEQLAKKREKEKDT